MRKMGQALPWVAAAQEPETILVRKKACGSQHLPPACRASDQRELRSPGATRWQVAEALEARMLIKQALEVRCDSQAWECTSNGASGRVWLANASAALAAHCRLRANRFRSESQENGAAEMSNGMTRYIQYLYMYIPTPSKALSCSGLLRLALLPVKRSVVVGVVDVELTRVTAHGVWLK